MRAGTKWILGAGLFAIAGILLTPISSPLPASSPEASDSLMMCSHTSRVIDEATSGRPEPVPVESVNGPEFRSFVRAVTDHVLSRLAGACLRHRSLEPAIDLLFVRLPLVSPGNDPLEPAPSIRTDGADIMCRLDSPWVKLAVWNSGPVLARAVFIWNERQFLQDQALLSGAGHPVTTVPSPLANRMFKQHARDYADYVLTSPPTPQTNAILAERIPADVLWLFRYSWQSTRGPFLYSAWGGMKTVLERAAGGHTKVVLGLINQCLASKAVEQRYENILQLNEIPLRDYKIPKRYE